MPRQAYRVRGLDCAHEVALLKRELRPIVDDDGELSFDLLNAKLIVDSNCPACTRPAVLLAVQRAGLRATPWEEHAARAAAPVSWRARHGHEAACAFAIAATLAGFLVHAALHGFHHAIAGAESGRGYPLPAALLLAAASLAGLWTAAPRAWSALRNLHADMHLLMTVAVAGAWALGNWTEAALVSTLFSAALLLEQWSVGRARRAIEALMDLKPQTARIVAGGIETERPVAEVAAGSIVAVHPGERVPLDGAVIEGESSVNQAPITGESAPAHKRPGSAVFAGSINNEGHFAFRVTRPADDTQLARIIRMVEEAQTRRAPAEQWVDRFAHYYTPAMMTFALLAALVPPLVFGADWPAAIYRALVLLLIACPCALVISTPVTIVAGLAAAARAGVLIKGGAFLEAAAGLRAVAIDKTGTLTTGEPEVQRTMPLEGLDETQVLRIAMALEVRSAHPVARAIVRHARARGIEPPRAEGVRALPGRGLEGTLDGRRIWAGSIRLWQESGGSGEDIEALARSLEDAGHSVVLAGEETRVLGLIAVADALRPQSAAAVEALRAAGVAHIAMLTGDNPGAAAAVAAAAGIRDCRAGLLPEEKLAAVEALRAQYGAVAMVGDGINDAPAMAAATLGIAMGAAGSDAALETADIALMSGDLDRLPWLLRHARRTLRIVRQNVVIALGLKLAVLALSLAGHAALWAAIAADMGASLVVIFNGLRLLRPGGRAAADPATHS